MSEREKPRHAVIFGTAELAEVADILLTKDSDYSVVAFTVNEAYLKDKDPRFRGKPVIPFEIITERFPPDRCAIFVAVGMSRLNDARMEIYRKFKEMGYEMVSYVSSRAVLEGENEIGEHVFILSQNLINPKVNIGNNSFLWNGNHIGHHTIIGDNVFIASHVVISGKCRIGDNCFMGVNSATADGVTIGEYSFIGMGVNITSDVPPKSVLKVDAAFPRPYNTDKMRNIPTE